ncbi:GNAT family N-acetyltransferase [Spirillospora sp. NPDC029432]|uniref:GNAT family N-acetyltransferase n=1 Tax=Spirillospora sp. NPDC029432 TaxID=3154599 RepID=UPI003453BA03
MEIREGGADDAPVLLAMLDAAVEWLASRGRTGQWGDTPWSTDPARAARVRDIAGNDDIRIALVDGKPAGAMALSSGPPRYVEPVDEPEVYVTLLVTDRACAGRGVGSALLRTAREEALRRGAALLRVDCYAGDDGRLVEYYTGNGFVRDRTFSVDGWPGQLLTRRL